VFAVEGNLAMSAIDKPLFDETPFSQLPLKGMHHSGLFVSGRRGVGLVTLAVRKARQATLASRVQEHFQIELPLGPRRAAAGGIAFAGLGPGVWLVTHERGHRVLVDVLKQAAFDVASIVDQSDGLAVLRLSGPAVRDTLCMLVPLDLHARAFDIDAVACTTVAHIAGILWRLGDCGDGTSVFEIAVHRSFCEYFWRALSASV
jgi:methylglutamate dehydrogenase subunit D